MIEQISSHYNELIFIMIGICILGVIIMIMPLILNKKKNKIKEEDLGLTDNDIKKRDKTISKDQIKKEAFSLYKKEEIAKSKFDYNALKEILTDSLYQKEELELKQLKENKQKLVATNIKLQEIKVLSINQKENIETINIYLYVSQYDYVINNEKKVVRGTDEVEYQIEYKITLERKKDESFKMKQKKCTGKWIKNK